MLQGQQQPQYPTYYPTGQQPQYIFVTAYPPGTNPGSQGYPYAYPPPAQQPSNPPEMPSYSQDHYDNSFQFDDESIRRSFIRKVYSILTVQLVITFGIISLFVFHEPTKLWVRQYPGLIYISLGILIVMGLVLACCGNVRRSFPMNFVCLAIFTLAESFVLGVISSFYKPDLVLMAVAITAIVCFSLTLFAFQTKLDFTVMGGILFVAVILLLVFGIVAMFFPGKTILLIYASLGVFLFSIFLIYDTQMMMGGKHKYSISPEEYIFAALTLYIDIVNIFHYVLMLLGLTDSS